MGGRSVSCATCGAQAPELTEEQRSFVCSYCQKQTFIEPRAPLQEAGAPFVGETQPFRERQPRWVALLLIALLIVVMAIVMAKVKRGPGAELADCEAFSGETMRAKWTGCPSKATREIACAPTFPTSLGLPAGAGAGLDSLTCDCLRDGTHTWFFTAESAPPLEGRESAERVAVASCKMW